MYIQGLNAITNMKILLLLLLLVSSTAFSIVPQGAADKTNWFNGRQNLGTLTTSTLHDWSQNPWLTFSVFGSPAISANQSAQEAKYIDLVPPNYNYLDTGSWDQSKPMTVFIVYRPYEGATSGLLFCSSTTAGNYGYLFEAYSTSSGYFVYVGRQGWCNGAGDASITKTYPAPYSDFGGKVTGNTFSIAGSWDGAQGMKAWFNGKYLGSATASGSGICGRGNCFRLACNKNNEYSSYAGGIYHFVVFNRILTNSEIAQLDEQLRRPLLSR